MRFCVSDRSKFFLSSSSSVCYAQLTRAKARRQSLLIYINIYIYTGSPLLLFFFFTNNNQSSLFRNTTLLTLLSFVRFVERRKMKKIQLEKILQHRCFLLLFLCKSLAKHISILQRFHPPRRSFLSIAFLFIPIFISRAEQMKRLFDASLQPGVPSAWFPVGFINTSRIVLRALD